MTTQTLGKDNLSNTPDIDGEKNLGGLGGLSGLENTPELNGVAGDLVQDPDLEARRQFTYEAGEKLKRRVDWHLLPLLILAYLVKNMDGNVVSYVKVMNSGKSTNVLKELDISTDQWADMSTIFTVFFFIFEIPSNLIIKWSTPRLHFVRIMGSWSIVVACTAAVKSMGGLFACRALLGAFEAGLYPGILYQLACWYRPDEIAIRMSALGLLGQFSGIIDALLAFGLAYIDGKGGLSGWRWCYLILGLLGFVVTLLIFLFLPDWPDSPPSRRQFLTPEEGTFFAARLPPNSARSTDLNFDWGAIKKELKSPILYGFALIQMLFASGVTGLSFWLPTVIAGFGLTSTANSQLLNIPPAALYCILALSIGRFLDWDTRVPRPALLIAAALSVALLFVGNIFATAKGARYVLILLCYVPNAVYGATLVPLRTQSVSGSSGSAFAFAFANCLGQLPGLYTAQIFRSKYAPRYAVPYVACIVFLVASATMAAFTWYWIYDLEKETRLVARKRRYVGETKGEVVLEDVTLARVSANRG